jgi:long-chain acyl-CoA synthetase
MNIELCCAEEVAHALGIQLDTLYRYARKGRIRGMKVGNSWRFMHADIQAFLQQHQYGATFVEVSHPAQVRPSLLPDILRRAALQSGVQRAITCGGAEASYADLGTASDLLADRLLSHGVVPDDRVLILLSNSLEFIAGCFAVWKAGAIVVAEDPFIQDQNLRLILRDCAPRLDVRRHGLENLRVVYVKDQTFQLPRLDGVRVESLDSALAGNTSPALIRLNSSSADDVAVITYPDGASGRIRGVMNTHENWLAGAAFAADYLGLTKQDILLLPLPLHQSLALRQMLAYIMAGARIILASDLDQALQCIKDQSPSALALRTDSMKLLLEKSSPSLQDLAGSFRYVEIGSAPLEEGKFESLRRLLPNTLIHPSCNLTEAQAAFLNTGPDGSLNRIGRLPPTLSLTLVDEHRRPVPPGQPGRILLKGPGLMKGFWGQSSHQFAMLVVNGYCTGERATTDKRGEIVLLGRKEETLNTRGHNINPADIEAVLQRHAHVAECAVVGLLDATGGFETKIHAFVVPTANGAMLTERDLKAHCRAFLPSGKVPARIHFQASLPRSEEGRVLREILKAAAQLASHSALGKVETEIPRFQIPRS